MAITAKRLVRTIAAIAAFYPALGAGDCSDLTGTKSKNYNGTYQLATVNGQTVSSSSPFYLYGGPGDATSLRLISGVWVVSGTSLGTTMTTISRFSGQDDPAYAEHHTGTISISGSSATATLDNGTEVYASLGSDAITYSTGSATLRFTKR